MSFDRLSSLESQPTTSRATGYHDDPEFHTLATSLSSRLFTLNSNISNLNQQLALVGSKKDSERVRDRVRKLLDETREGFKSISEGVKRIQNWPDVSPSQRFTQDKLSHQFASLLTDFQAAQRLSAEKTRQYVTAAKAAQQQMHDEGMSPEDLAYTDEPREGGQQLQVPLVQTQAALADQGEVDFQEDLIIQREEEIRGIEHDITEINDIFRDLGIMVSEQGELVDAIHDNVSKAATDHRAADRELTQAARSQKGARNKACCLLLILAIVLAVVLLAVFLG